VLILLCVRCCGPLVDEWCGPWPPVASTVSRTATEPTNDDELTVMIWNSLLQHVTVIRWSSYQHACTFLIIFQLGEVPFF